MWTTHKIWHHIWTQSLRTFHQMLINLQLRAPLYICQTDRTRNRRPSIKILDRRCNFRSESVWLPKKKLSVTPKHVKVPRNEEYCTGIAGLDNICNPFKTVKISASTNIREIGSIDSRQAKKKGRKLASINHPKLSQTDPNSSTLNATKPSSDDKLTIKKLLKRQLRDEVQAFKDTN